MKISTSIHELLLENETVIIPGFGAFISHYKPAEILPENDEIKPPSKELSFNQKIRNNDGLLVGHIAEKEGISHFDALKEIERDRENIIYQLDKGEKITFENVGILFRNENNEIEFESFQQENLLLDSFGLETTSLIQDEPATEEVTQDELTNKIHKEHTEPEKLVKSEEEKQENIQEPPVEESEPDLENVEKSIPAQNEHGEKKKLGWLWSLLIFVPIVVAGVFLYTKQNQKDNPSEIKQESSVPENGMVKSEEIPVVDTTKTDTVKSEPASAIQTGTSTNQIIPAETSNPGNYYLVGGSFKEEENAEKFMQEFNAEGYTPFKLGKRGNFYIIAIGRFKTEKEAVIAQNKFIEKNPDSGTWVYKDETK